MPANLQSVFTRLRQMLQAHASGFTVAPDSARAYGLEAPVGPATLRAWGGKLRRPRIPVAWASVEKSYVSYHLMGIGDARLRAGLSQGLQARLTGQTCFNFNTVDEPLFAELADVTARGLTAFRAAGFIQDA